MQIALWINISFLITIGLVPFSTALLAEYRAQQIPIFVYSFNSILAGVIIHALYHHAKGDLELVDKTAHALIKNRSGRRVLVTMFTYIMAILISFMYLPVSVFLFLLVLVPEFLPDRFFGSEA